MEQEAVLPEQPRPPRRVRKPRYTPEERRARKLVRLKEKWRKEREARERPKAVIEVVEFKEDDPSSEVVVLGYEEILERRGKFRKRDCWGPGEEQIFENLRSDHLVKISALRESLEMDQGLMLRFLVEKSVPIYYIGLAYRVFLGDFVTALERAQTNVRANKKLFAIYLGALKDKTDWESRAYFKRRPTTEERDAARLADSKRNLEAEWARCRRASAGARGKADRRSVLGKGQGSGGSDGRDGNPEGGS